MSGIGIAPDSNSNTGCVSVHKVGLSTNQSVNSSINVSGGEAILPPLSLKYSPQTDVMKFTANLSTSNKKTNQFSRWVKVRHISPHECQRIFVDYLGATIGNDFNWSQHVFWNIMKSSISCCANSRQENALGPTCCIHVPAAHRICST